MKKRTFSVQVLKEANLFLGEKSDPLISFAFVRIKLNFKLFPEGEINNFSPHPLSAFFHSLGIHHFSIFSDSIFIALSPGNEDRVRNLIYLLRSL